MIPAHDDTRYAAVLANVGLRISAAEAVHVRTLTLLADLRRPRCARCYKPFTPTNATGRRQIYCHEPACDRERHTQRQRRWRLHVQALRIDRTPLGRDLVCGCGAMLEPKILAGGGVVDHCPVCGTLTPTRRAA